LTSYEVVHIFMRMTLRELRQQKGLTQEGLASAVATTQETISGLETGRIRKPSWDLVAKIAAVLDVEPREIFPVDLPGHQPSLPLLEQKAVAS
jgi:putative transcriptional regulator